MQNLADSIILLDNKKRNALVSFSNDKNKNKQNEEVASNNKFNNNNNEKLKKKFVRTNLKGSSMRIQSRNTSYKLMGILKKKPNYNSNEYKNDTYYLNLNNYIYSYIFFFLSIF